MAVATHQFAHTVRELRELFFHVYSSSEHRTEQTPAQKELCGDLHHVHGVHLVGHVALHGGDGRVARDRVSERLPHEIRRYVAAEVVHRHLWTGRACPGLRSGDGVGYAVARCQHAVRAAVRPGGLQV